MKVVVALDSFKECMSAYEACQAVCNGLKKIDRDIEVDLCPIGDGGEGTLDALIQAMNGRKVGYDVHDVLMRKRKVYIGYVDDIAIIESAKVCGLELLEEHQKDALYTSTYGLGELIKNAINEGAKKLMICLGGSATNDGGIGMLSALGVEFYDKNHRIVEPTLKGLCDIVDFDKKNLDELLHGVEIVGVCDVQNILCGQFGATYIYGVQKGIKKEECEIYDRAMHRYAVMVDQFYGYDYRCDEGTGAAGGLGYALLAFCHGTLQKGFDVVSRVCQLEKRIKSCDLVIVGEGKMDKQTQYGKTPYGVLQIAQKYHKAVYAFAGKIEDRDILYQLGFSQLYSITPQDMPLQEALSKGKENMEKAICKYIRRWSHEI